MHNYYEYEQCHKLIIVNERLKEHVQFWRSIGSSDFILDTIENDYKLALYSTPSKTVCKNNRSVLLNSDFVNEAIRDLLD